MTYKITLQKGDLFGVCYREACSNKGVRFYNSSTRKYYCSSCARAINDANRSWIKGLFGKNKDLCTLVTGHFPTFHKGHRVNVSYDNTKTDRLYDFQEYYPNPLNQLHLASLLVLVDDKLPEPYSHQRKEHPEGSKSNFVGSSSPVNTYDPTLDLIILSTMMDGNDDKAIDSALEQVVPKEAPASVVEPASAAPVVPYSDPEPSSWAGSSPSIPSSSYAAPTSSWNDSSDDSLVSRALDSVSDAVSSVADSISSSFD